MAIHPSAIIHPTATVDPTNEIGPAVQIGENCVLGPGNTLMQGAILGPNTVVGRGNVFHFYSVVGHDPQFLGFNPATKSGTVIGDENHFREFSQIHRGLKDGTNTVVGSRNFFMATSHVAHDCLIGNDNVLANYAGLAGHVSMGDRCFISTLVGVHQFCRIGSLAMIGGRTGIPKDVPPYMMMKHYGEVVGINTVGLRRAGVTAEARAALKNAYKKLFRTGMSLTEAVAAVRGEWAGREMPAELLHLLEFCTTKSKRGMSHGPRRGIGAGPRLDDEDDD
ncbi:acyl-ACP--UDP-N-acetylglucosamine O-acyltransferase [bacterium]|nr:acyl-ACP--UDP-N-acetylglucosamine O-acyltransferase [bacterium]